MGIVDGYTDGLRYMIEAEKDSNSRNDIAELGVRVQTGGMTSDPTAKHAIRNVMTRDALINCDFSGDVLDGVDHPEAYMKDAYILKDMRRDYKLFNSQLCISDDAINRNCSYILINKEIERVSKNAVKELNSKDVILVFPSQRKNNTTVRVMKTPKTESSVRKIYIPRYVAEILVQIKKEQDEIREALGSEYQDYNLIMATTFGLPPGESYIRSKMQDVIDKEGLPDVVFHSIRHTSITYKLKLSGGDIKAVQGDSGHAQADMITEVYGHIMDEDRIRNAQRMEKAFYNKENLNPDIHGQLETNAGNMVAVPEGIDAEALMKVLGNPEMAALLASLSKTVK